MALTAFLKMYIEDTKSLINVIPVQFDSHPSDILSQTISYLKVGLQCEEECKERIKDAIARNGK